MSLGARCEQNQLKIAFVCKSQGKNVGQTCVYVRVSLKFQNESGIYLYRCVWWYICVCMWHSQ